MRTKIIQDILNYVGFTIIKWKELFCRYEDARSISISTISGWKQGKQNMGKNYREIFINILCEQDELKKYEQDIRRCVMKNLKLAIYLDSYWMINNMDYRDFLNYVLEKYRVNDIRNDEYNWDNISISTLLQVCLKKTKTIKQRVEIKVQDEMLQLEYMHNDIQRYKVYVGFNMQNKECINIGDVCDRLKKKTVDALLIYIFVTQDISEQIYMEMLKKYNVILVKIDFYDINQVEEVDNFIANIYPIQEEKTIYFMNALADVIMRKVFKMNYIVLKEIMCYNYDFNKVNEHFFESNAGLWMYQYPMRRALAFEEKLIKRILNTSAKRGKKDLRILDINLSGGMLGLRCSFNAGRVTCVDVSYRCVEGKKRIIDRYNYTKSQRNEGLTNIDFGFLQVDTMNIVGVQMPEEGYDLIILGLGGGSYIEDLDDFLKQVSGWLKEDKNGRNQEGKMILSVFNSEALYFDSSLASQDFRYDFGNFWHVGDEWPIQAKLYTHKQICNLAMKYYELLENYSYPTVLSVVRESYNNKILEKLKEIDKTYAYVDIDTSSKGLLHTLYLKKTHRADELQCNLKIKNYLREEKIVYKIVEHEEITSKAKMIRELNRKGVLAGDNFIKTVVLKDDRYNILIYFLLPLNKNFKKDYLEKFYVDKKLKLVKNKLRFCKESELQKMGLTTGSVSPFSYSVIEKDLEQYLICDLEIQNTGYSILYTYSGDLKITYRIDKSSFLSYLKKNSTIFV